MNISVKRERIAVSVTSSEFNDDHDVLLGVLEAESFKGRDLVSTILQHLEYFEISDQIFAVCTDTTASNTGSWSGAISIQATIMDKPLLWFMCRRHIPEHHISHVMTVITGEKTKAPRREIYVRLQKNWETVKPTLDTNKLVKFSWETIETGSELHRIALNSLEYCQRALTLIVCVPVCALKT